MIGHRGASGHRPEHTALAYRLAYRMGADSVEPDLVVTRDGVLICHHDVELSRTTDVADRPDLAHRRTVELVGGRPVEGFFVHELDLAEVATLKVRERWPRKRPASARFDDQLGVVTFEQLLRIRRQEQARLGRPLAVHAEVKTPRWFDERGLPVAALVESVVRRQRLDGVAAPHRRLSPLSVMTFDAAFLAELAGRVEVPLVQLLDTSGRPGTGTTSYRRMRSRNGLDAVAEYATAIGARKELVLPRDRHDASSRPTKLVDRAHARGLDVLVWTLRSENVHLPADLRQGRRPRRHGRAGVEVSRFLDAGVDGLLTDFPDVAARVVAERGRDVGVAARAG